MTGDELHILLQALREEVTLAIAALDGEEGFEVRRYERLLARLKEASAQRWQPC